MVQLRAEITSKDAESQMRQKQLDMKLREMEEMRDNIKSRSRSKTFTTVETCQIYPNTFMLVFNSNILTVYLQLDYIEWNCCHAVSVCHSL